ncbi:MAG: RNA-binding cell elongation regulator Jag/EloR [Anaerolineae bacterium]
MPGGNASLESSAKTVEEAIEHGLAVMGLDREEVEIEILSKGSRGVFGLGAEDAVVRLTAKAQTAEEEPVEVPAGDDISHDATSAAVALLEKLLALMDVRAEVETYSGADLVEEGEDPPLVLNIKGNDLGILIGRRGETLGAIQYMLRLMLGRELGHWEPVVVDVESYRRRRRRSLRQLARRMAERAALTHQKVVLEAMPAYERRIIHLALRDHPQVVTQSVGEGQNRKVTILPK